jgi:hypothetical protein
VTDVLLAFIGVGVWRGVQAVRTATATAAPGRLGGLWRGRGRQQTVAGLLHAAGIDAPPRGLRLRRGRRRQLTLWGERRRNGRVQDVRVNDWGTEGWRRTLRQVEWTLWSEERRRNVRQRLGILRNRTTWRQDVRSLRHRCQPEGMIEQVWT